MTGTNDNDANAAKISIDCIENASDELVIVFNVLPAWMAKNDGGATPKNVPIANGYNGTPITGATKLINQFGRNGVIRRNKM